MAGVHRGEIWWADLPAPTGSEPGYRRPVVVIQADVFNISRIQTVIIAAMATNLELANAPGNVLAPAGDTGLPRDSVVNISQVLTVDRRRLIEVAGHMPSRLLRSVEDGLRLVLQL